MVSGDCMCVCVCVCVFVCLLVLGEEGGGVGFVFGPL